MTAKPRDPAPAFALRIDRAATPQRVAEIAQLFIDIATHLGMPEGHSPITMIVSNYDLAAAMRGWDKPSREALARVAEVASDPVRAVRRWAPAREIARDLARFGARNDEANVRIERRGRIVATLDRALVDTLRAVAASDVRRVRGTTEVTSRVFRYGRSKEDGQLQARIRIGESYTEVRVAPVASRKVAAAVDDDREHVLSLNASWSIDARGGMHFEPAKSTVVDLRPFEGMSGEDFLTALDAAGGHAPLVRDEEGFWVESEDSA